MAESRRDAGDKIIIVDMEKGPEQEVFLYSLGTDGGDIFDDLYDLHPITIMVMKRWQRSGLVLLTNTLKSKTLQ